MVSRVNSEPQEHTRTIISKNKGKTSRSFALSFFPSKTKTTQIKNPWFLFLSSTPKSFYLSLAFPFSPKIKNERRANREAARGSARLREQALVLLRHFLRRQSRRFHQRPRRHLHASPGSLPRPPLPSCLPPPQRLQNRPSRPPLPLPRRKMPRKSLVLDFLFLIWWFITFRFFFS